MRVSEKSLELNVGAEILALIRGPWGRPKAYLRGLTQREERQEGVDFFTHLGSAARMIALQFKAPLTGPEHEPYRFRLVKEQHDLLYGLGELAPDSVFYVFPFFVTPAKLRDRVPELLGDTWLLAAAQMQPDAVFNGQRTRVIRCADGWASVNPEYRLVAPRHVREKIGGIPAAEFARWFAVRGRDQVSLARHRSPWLVRGLRLAIFEESGLPAQEAAKGST